MAPYLVATQPRPDFAAQSWPWIFLLESYRMFMSSTWLVHSGPYGFANPFRWFASCFPHVFPTTRMISMALCKNFFAQPSRCERVSVQKLMEKWKSQSWKATNNFLPKSPNFDNETTARNRICSKKKKCNVYPRLINMSLLTQEGWRSSHFQKDYYHLLPLFEEGIQKNGAD